MSPHTVATLIGERTLEQEVADSIRQGVGAKFHALPGHRPAERAGNAFAAAFTEAFEAGRADGEAERDELRARVEKLEEELADATALLRAVEMGGAA